MPAPTGEQIQQLGDQGSQRAKRWLESTCRAEVKWNNPTLGISKLQFRKAGAQPNSMAQGDWFSYDLGGTFLGGENDGEVFLAESKKYQNAGNQGSEYRKFLAKCYRVQSDVPNYVDSFLWITWAPFSVTDWADLLTAQYAEASVNGNDACKYVAIGPGAYDPDVGNTMIKKVLIVVLSDGQEVALSLHGNELLHVRKALLELRSQ